MAARAEVTYFGYGTTGAWAMMDALIGRVPQGRTASLYDYELVIQQPSEAPPPAKTTLGFHFAAEEVESYRTYAICPRVGASVIGMAWKVTPLERELLARWNMEDLGFQVAEVELDFPGEMVQATTEVIEDPYLPAADSNRRTYLNDRRRTLEVARQLRTEWIGG